ncbi:cytochrome c oxidase assembly protein [Salipiger mucosus]|uniref:Cytochrome c oxidase assembly protein CtaG n=1 Tax=Salipiger mucosus DSM 16094 TaxID=1123237 RepID=S9QFY6_9RHOB|nr:cytochrome c oxidase assembly protein [Salipiger mucosus]EPX78787.1 Cytochrome oxidase biogenesis protein Cox11-CtaG, copper delivery to Cox1 [Salipiger mucosus DSM 16094]
MKTDGNNPKKTVLQLVGVVLFMGGMAWASVPLYDFFCRVTGYGGETGVASATTGEVLEREITVRFDASKERGMPWEFKPMQTEMTVKIGQDGLAFYEAYNPTDRPIAGQAAYNVYPFDAGNFFNKIACFCFTEQVLMPGERVEMPVNFFVDPAIVNDPDAKHTNHITLSYTFYEIDLPEEVQASLETENADASSVN